MEWTEIGTLVSSAPVVVLAGFIMAILQAIKAIPLLQGFKEWYRLLAMAIGIGLCYALSAPNPVLMDIAGGLAACGGYDFIKPPANG